MKKTPILFVCAAMMLTGCSGATATIKDKDETIMTIGDKNTLRVMNMIC